MLTITPIRDECDPIKLNFSRTMFIHTMIAIGEINLYEKLEGVDTFDKSMWKTVDSVSIFRGDFAEWYVHTVRSAGFNQSARATIESRICDYTPVILKIVNEIDSNSKTPNMVIFERAGIHILPLSGKVEAEHLYQNLCQYITSGPRTMGDRVFLQTTSSIILLEERLRDLFGSFHGSLENSRLYVEYFSGAFWNIVLKWDPNKNDLKRFVKNLGEDKYKALPNGTIARRVEVHEDYDYVVRGSDVRADAVYKNWVFRGKDGWKHDTLKIKNVDCSGCTFMDLSIFAEPIDPKSSVIHRFEHESGTSVKFSNSTFHQCHFHVYEEGKYLFDKCKFVGCSFPGLSACQFIEPEFSCLCDISDTGMLWTRISTHCTIDGTRIKFEPANKTCVVYLGDKQDNYFDPGSLVPEKSTYQFQYEGSNHIVTNSVDSFNVAVYAALKMFRCSS